MRFVGMYRIKNEATWIEEVIRSALPLCEHIFILDDHSSDETMEICNSIDRKRITLFPSPFEGLDETRDKNFLYDRILSTCIENEAGFNYPDWICCIDGDEVFDENSYKIIRKAAEKTTAYSLSLRIMYLWDRPDQVRVDGVYANFHRPSIFKVINPAFRWNETPWHGNLHCSSIPQELQGNSERIPAILWHYGYMDKGKRLQKWEWYNTVDPGNKEEDFYLHMLIGDIPDLPRMTKTKWAGPLQLQDIPGRRKFRER